MSDDAHNENLFGARRWSVSEKVDFEEEHSERQKLELDYAKGMGVPCQKETYFEVEFPVGNYEPQSNGDSPSMVDQIFMVQEGSGKSCSNFNAEVERAQKHFLDAREVSLIDWKVRDNTNGLLEKLCISIKEIISKKHVESGCKEREKLSPKTLFEQVDVYFMLLRKSNEELEGTRRVSQLLDNVLLQLEDVLGRFRELSSLGNCKEVDKQVFCDRIDTCEQFYLSVGTDSTSLFYEKNDIYEKLKTKPYRICCVCGIKSLIADESSELKNALAFKDLLVVEDEELAEWKALKKDDEDELGALAQQCFHIAKVEQDKRYYHLLNVNDPDPDNPMEKSCCLINDGKLTRLPACDECFDRLKKADKFLKEETDTNESSAYLDSPSKFNDSGLSRWDTAVGMLKRLCFKRCDIGRIPKSLPKLSNCGRTAIAPFTAYTIIRQLRSSRNLPGSAQHSSKGSMFSVPSEGVAGKEFVIPLLHDEFIDSFQRELPRANVAMRHRVLFLGNDKNWRSMESTLNRQNRGQYFNACDSYNFLKLLKKTGALSEEFTVKRKGCLGLLQRKVDMEMSRTTRTTDSSTGIVLEDSLRIKQMDSACSDDVAAARLLTENDGMKTTVSGITSSMF